MLTAQIFDGDIVELDDPRGGKRRLYAGTVDIIEGGDMSHISVTWGRRPILTAPTATAVANLQCLQRAGYSCDREPSPDRLEQRAGLPGPGLAVSTVL